MQRILRKIFILMFFLLTLPMSVLAETSMESHPIESLVGEELTYDVSFLWFSHLADGKIRLSRGEKPGTFIALLEAKTRGFAAFVTRHRIEQYRTLMEIGPDGLLRPLVYSSHTLKGKGAKQREKVTSYTFDYADSQVHYQKAKNNYIQADEYLPLATDEPTFDILSAFYNLRIGSFGPFDEQQVSMPTFHRKGVEEIVVAPVVDSSEDSFFSKDSLLCKVLLDPEVFGTNGRDLFVSFDQNNRPQRAVVKNVIGLGDVKGVLRQAIPPLAQVN